MFRLLLLLMAACNSAFAQDAAKLHAISNQLNTSLPADVETATTMLDDAAGDPSPAGVNWGAIDLDVDGLDGGNFPVFVRSFNTVAADTIGTDELRASGSLKLGLTGAGTRIGMWEVSDPIVSHTEFEGVSSSGVVDKDGVSSRTNDAFHATHVAGTLVARGASPTAKGMSPDATLDAYDLDLALSELAAIYATADTSDDLQVSNHSYGRVAGWSGTYTHTNGVTYPVWLGEGSISWVEDYKFGYYDADAQTLDQVCYLQEVHLPIWAAGNDRGEDHLVTAGSSFIANFFGQLNFVLRPYPEEDGGADGYDTIPAYGTAKNVLTVGAINDIVGGYSSPSDVVAASFSAAGPTDDGRIKPDVCANGVGVFSADDPVTSPIGNSQIYNSLDGTSMATPGVAGTLNLLCQLHTQLHGSGSKPKASTIKAWAIHTADAATANGSPTYLTGWGVLNAKRAASLIMSDATAQSPYIIEDQVSTGGTWTKDVVAIGGQAIKATVVWTDPQGTIHAPALNNGSLKLVNDLDLRITEGGNTFMPWILDPNNPSNVATTGDNSRDNVEQIVVATPTSGETYTVSISPSV